MTSMRHTAEPAQPWEKLGWQATSLLVLGLAFSAFVVWWFAFSDDYADVEILSAAVESDVVHLALSECGIRAYQVEIDDREDGVYFTVRVRDEHGDDDCVDGITVGGGYVGRTLIDATTGERIPVTSPQ